MSETMPPALATAPAVRLAPTAADDELLLARAYLSRVAEPASFVIWRFVRDNGPIEAAKAIRSGRVPPEVHTLTLARRAIDPFLDLDAAAHHGIRFVTPESPDWPQLAFGALERVAEHWLATGYRPSAADQYGGQPMPPLALWVKGSGELSSLGLRCAAIVGARSATTYGEHVAACWHMVWLERTSGS